MPLIWRKPQVKFILFRQSIGISRTPSRVFHCYYGGRKRSTRWESNCVGGMPQSVQRQGPQYEILGDFRYAIISSLQFYRRRSSGPRVEEPTSAFSDLLSFLLGPVQWTPVFVMTTCSRWAKPASELPNLAD